MSLLKRAVQNSVCSESLRCLAPGVLSLFQPKSRGEPQQYIFENGQQGRILEKNKINKKFGYWEYIFFFCQRGRISLGTLLQQSVSITITAVISN